MNEFQDRRTMQEIVLNARTGFDRLARDLGNRGGVAEDVDDVDLLGHVA